MVTPLLATSTLSALPSQAATFASSFGDLQLTNFSESFATIESDNDADTSVFANGGTASVNNQAVVDTDSSEAFAFATSEVFGESKDYFALAQTQATIVGNFFIDPGTTFSFDFQSFLDLETFIDEPPTENATALGELSFSLYDTSNIPENSLPDFLTNLLSDPTNIQTSPLAFFSLSGNLNTAGSGDFVNTRKSDNISLSIQERDFNNGGNEEFASAVFAGSFQRRFDNPANLTLVALRKTEARATAPEPSNTLALLALPGLLGIATKARRKATTPTRSFDRKVTKITVG